MEKHKFKDRILPGEIPWMSWELLALSSIQKDFIMPEFPEGFFEWEIIIPPNLEN